MRHIFLIFVFKFISRIRLRHRDRVCNLDCSCNVAWLGMEAVPRHAASVPWQRWLHPFAWPGWQIWHVDSTDLRADENRCSSSHSRCWFAGCRLQGVYTERSSDRLVGPTGLSDWSVRRSYRVNASFDRSDRRSKNQTCLISSDCRSDCRSMWTLRPTGRTDRPVGRPITLQRRRYLLLTS